MQGTFNSTMGAGSNTVRKKRTENGRFFLITADQIRVHLSKKVFYGFLAKCAGSDTYRIQYNRMLKFIGFFSGKDAGIDLASSGTPVFKRVP